MLIVDSQVHVWDADTPERPCPQRAEPHRPVPLGANDLLREMNAAGVDRVVIVPPSWEGDRNDLAIEAHMLHPDRFATMGRLDPQDRGSRDRIMTWREQPGMLGLRFTFHIPQLVPLLTEGHMDWIWSEAHVTMFTEEMPWLTYDDEEWIMGRGVCEWLGWETP